MLARERIHSCNVISKVDKFLQQDYYKWKILVSQRIMGLSINDSVSFLLELLFVGTEISLEVVFLIFIFYLLIIL
jgi:hypothetical protein